MEIICIFDGETEAMLFGPSEASKIRVDLGPLSQVLTVILNLTCR